MKTVFLAEIQLSSSSFHFQTITNKNCKPTTVIWCYIMSTLRVANMSYMIVQYLRQTCPNCRLQWVSYSWVKSQKLQTLCFLCFKNEMLLTLLICIYALPCRYTVIQILSLKSATRRALFNYTLLLSLFWLEFLSLRNLMTEQLRS